MHMTPVSSTVLHRYAPSTSNRENALKNYFKFFESLKEKHNWDAIMSLGTAALEEARKKGQVQEEAKICAQLTSTAFYKGDYPEALKYANRSYELAEAFPEPSPLLRALYLQSAVYRALASKQASEMMQQDSYARAIEITQAAALIYSEKEVNNPLLKGKIYFNMGAAHADNPIGDFQEAEKCYSIALQCFENMGAIDDFHRTLIRMGKIHLLQKKYTSTQDIITRLRPLVSNERVSMHIDYVEAQLNLEIDEPSNAIRIANNGLAKAKALNAEEDVSRFTSLLKSIDRQMVEKNLLSTWNSIGLN